MVYPSYVLDMLRRNALGKKNVYYRNIKYITLNTENLYNNRIFNDSIQINIKLTFTVYEYMNIHFDIYR